MSLGRMVYRRVPAVPPVVTGCSDVICAYVPENNHEKNSQDGGYEFVHCSYRSPDLQRQLSQREEIH